jgi:hypothetical protein
MGVTVYRSTDASAPVLNGTTGTLISVLDACLVNGYGSKPAAGWTKAFSGTNLAAYKMGGSIGHYLRVDDSGPGSSGAQEARLRGFVTMSDVNTGTGPFPTVAQLSAGVIVRKSSIPDSTARTWLIVADNKTLYMWVFTGDAADRQYGWSFGEFFSLNPTDPMRTIIIARSLEGSASMTASVDGLGFGVFGLGSLDSSVVGGYVAGTVNGDVSSTAFARLGDAGLITSATTSGGVYVGSIQFPNPINGLLYVSPIRLKLGISNAQIRGRLRGLWHWGHPFANAVNGMQFAGIETLAGRQFMIVKGDSTSSTLWVIEISNTWDTN